MSDFLLRHRALWRRGLIFVAGGLVSYLLNLLPYTLLTRRLGWPHDAAYAVSLTWVTLLMFFWNYRVNFPTTRHWRECATRYPVSVAGAWALNFSAVRWLKMAMPASAAIFVVGFVIAALKFGIYHWWVFPHEKDVPLT